MDKGEEVTKEMLSEAFHTAFRKATEWKGSHEIWKLIQKMPDEDWGAVIDFVYDTALKERENGAPEVRKFTKDERSVLLYLETCLVDQSGRCEDIRMNKEDFEAISKFREEGLIRFGRIAWRELERVKKIYRSRYTHWVRFSDRAWEIVWNLRKERSERTIEKLCKESEYFKEEVR